MSLQIVQRVIENIAGDFAANGIPLIEINLGYCADFADAVWTELKAADVEVQLFNLDDYWAVDGGVDRDALARRETIQLPPGLDWDMLTALDIAAMASHTWIEYGGKCFDAERANGIDSPFEFSCVRHAMTEVLERNPIVLESLVRDHRWWREAIEHRAVRESLVPHLFTPKPISNNFRI